MGVALTVNKELCSRESLQRARVAIEALILLTIIGSIVNVSLHMNNFRGSLSKRPFTFDSKLFEIKEFLLSSYFPGVVPLEH